MEENEGGKHKIAHAQKDFMPQGRLRQTGRRVVVFVCVCVYDNLNNYGHQLVFVCAGIKILFSYVPSGAWGISRKCRY